MTDNRPKNLNLFTIHFPLPAIISILHRISGIILFIFIPFILWALDSSLASEDTFRSLHYSLTTPFAKLIIWLGLAPFLYHFVAGIRHLLMDVNVGVELKGGRLSAMITLGVTVFLMLIAGIYLW